MSNHDRTPDPDVELGERLRRALHTEAGTTVVRGDGLSLIRERVSGPRLFRWWQPVAGLAAAAAVVAIAAGTFGDSPQSATTVAGEGAGTVAADQDPPPYANVEGTDSPDYGSGVATAPAGPGDEIAGPLALISVPVYYLHDDTTGVGLYREFHLVPELAGGRTPTAVAQMLSAPAVDPDYTSLWAPGTRVLSYQRDGAVATVDLSAEALAGAPAGSEAAELSLQQLVYTVTAAEEDSALAVRVTVEGESVDQLWGSVEADQPVRRADRLAVLGDAWLLWPAQGLTVQSPVQLTVYGTAYEGHTAVRIFPVGSTEPVVDTFVTTAMGEFREAATTADLPAGRYVARVYTEYGEEMTLLERDSKEFTVE